jgi:hypothetical protein
LSLAGECERGRGHAPDQRALANMRRSRRQDARRQGSGALGFVRLLRERKHTRRRAELGALSDVTL